MGLIHLPRVEARPVRAVAWLLIWAGALAGNLTAAGEQGQNEAPDRSAPAGQVTALQVAPSSGTAGSVGGVGEEPASSERTELNLLGEVDAESGESRRNENVQLTLVDNNVLKELNIRMGTSAMIVQEFDAAQGYFGSEFGNPPSRQVHAAPLARRDLHGSVYATHGNSVFSARSFFQVGAVQPARKNDYGAQLSIPLVNASAFTVDLSQQRNRGNVNGNVLILLPEERVPLAKDPALRAMVSRILESFPTEPPNRPDINPRAHNTNAPQEIDNDSAGGRFDLPLGTDDRALAEYRFRKQHVEAFQLVQGQNPNTTTGSHDARLTWNRAWSPATTSDVSARFRRVTSLIVQDETALGPLIFTGRQLETLGGSSSIPYDRVQNFFSYAGALTTTKGNHRVSAGLGVTREQLNGIESSGHLGMIMFTSNFGRDMVTNLRLGTPSRISQSFGTPHRGFRRWRTQLFAGDTWTARRDLTLSLGLRYETMTSPTEVNALSELPFGCDCNNFGPRFGFAYRTPGGVLRGAYGLHYGEVFTATYSQHRFTPPGNVRLSIVAPDLLDPLAGLSSDALDPSTRSTIFEFSPDLVSPYSHQYNFSWDVASSKGLFAQLGYVGSRSHKLISGWVFNRARDMPGIERITGTVNDRRPDSRYFDIRHVLNGSRAYFDAAKATFGVRGPRSLTLDVSYWMSKAIDLGAHYASNATSRDAYMGRSQTEHNVHGDVKALSAFDQSHAMLSRLGYQTPRIRATNGIWNKALGEWNLTSILLLKTGTPFMVQTGSDAPGFGNVDGVSGDRPRLLDPAVLGRTIDHPDTSQGLMPKSAFGFLRNQDPSGDLGRNVFRKDGIQNVNLSVSRSWKLAGERTLMFRAESINLFNTPQFADPGSALTGDNFGQITNTLNDGRTFNFTMRLSF